MRKHLFTKILSVTFLTSLAYTLQAANVAIYKSGDLAPGTTDNARFYSFNTPVMDKHGKIGFRGLLLPDTNTVTVKNNSGIWLGDSLIAREGFQAPGTPSGAVFSSLKSPLMNNSGQLSYQAELRTGTGGVTHHNNTGLWQNTTLLGREGFQAPDTPSGTVFSSFNTPQINTHGHTAYRGILRSGINGITTANNQGLWLGNTLLARENDQAPGTPTGAVFSFFTDPVLNNNNQIAFVGTLLRDQGGVYVDNDLGIWRNNTLIAREGNPAPDTFGTPQFLEFSSPKINNHGQVAYWASLRYGGSQNTNDSGIWLDNTIIVREGDAAQGTPQANFSRFHDPVLNDNGLVAYKAFLRHSTGDTTSSNDSGIWRNNQLIARKGFQAGDVSTAATFAYVSDPVLNNHGQLAYQGFLNTGLNGVTQSNDGGLWISGLYGDHVLVAREGDRLSGQKVKNLVVHEGSHSDGHGNAFNDYGQLAYKARFIGGDEAIMLYTPDLHWRPTTQGNWDTLANWTLGLNPEHVHQVFIDPSASLTVNGPAGHSTIKSLQLGGGEGMATLQLQAGGQLTVNDSVIIKAQGVLTGQGTLDSTGGIENKGEIEADNLTLNGTVINHGLISGHGLINARVINQRSGIIKAAPLQTLQLSASNHTNLGRVQVLKGQLKIAGAFVNSVGGRIILDDGEIDFQHQLTNYGALQNTFGESHLSGRIINQSDIIISGNSTAHFFGRMENQGNIRVSNHAHALFYETVTGSGDFTGSGHKTILGVFDPGNSTALVSDEGDTTLGAGAELIIEIAGETIGTQHDHFAVQGHLQLGGTLTLALLDGYTPEVGDSFDILDWGTSSGVFDQLDTTQASGILWDVSNLYNTGIIRVASLTGFSTPSVAAVQPVPLPASIWMLISALGTLSLWRKQQHKR